jgi:hypothetical protein
MGRIAGEKVQTATTRRVRVDLAERAIGLQAERVAERYGEAAESER